MRKKSLFFLTAVVFMFFSCASIEERLRSGFGKNRDTEIPQYNDVQEYTALGEGDSFVRSVNKAKISAIKQGVIDIIGIYAEQTNQERLQEILYDTENPNRYIVNADMKILQKTKNGKIYICKAVIPVKMQEIASLLKTEGINSDGGKTGSIAKSKDADTVLAESKAAAKSNENVEFLNNYIETMTYMVFNAENSATDAFLLKSAVETANGYLLKQGYRAVDAAEVEKLKKDNALLYRESAAENLSVIQFIAQKLNADVYMELDAVTEGGYDYGGYYGSAKITLKIFNPSTGELLGSVPYSSPKTFSKTSSYDAQSNAVQSTVYKALPIAIDQAKLLLAKAYSGGIRYELIINDTPDGKSLARFRKELKNNVKDLKTVYQSAAQTKYAVFLFGTIDDLEAVIYETAEVVPGFEKMELVMLRGKALTFKSGF